MPRQYSICKYTGPEGGTLKINTFYVFLGEIPNMPGHCIVFDYHNPKHQIFAGYHINFVEVNEEEL
ncbi:MAG TPA: hypothetical protein VJN02_03160 [Gammaproteobacteria bacterium]|nr:hypothetical protein [Gammaproteobacteria bacterium]